MLRVKGEISMNKINILAEKTPSNTIIIYIIHIRYVVAKKAKHRITPKNYVNISAYSLLV